MCDTNIKCTDCTKCSFCENCEDCCDCYKCTDCTNCYFISYENRLKNIIRLDYAYYEITDKSFNMKSICNMSIKDQEIILRNLEKREIFRD